MIESDIPQTKHRLNRSFAICWIQNFLDLSKRCNDICYEMIGSTIHQQQVNFLRSR